MAGMKLMNAASITALVAAAQTSAEADEANAAEDEAGPAAPAEEAAGSEPEAGKDKDAKEPKAPASPDKDDDDDDTQAVVPAADALAVAKSERAAGAKEERDRTAAVLGSEEGKANYPDAAFMLAHTDASADKIIAELKSRGPAGTTLSTEPAEPEAGIEDTNVDLGHGTDPKALEEKGGEAEAGSWDKSISRVSEANGFGTVAPAATAPAAPAAGTNAAGHITVKPAALGGVGH